MKEKMYNLYYARLEETDKALDAIVYNRDKKLKKLNRRVARKTKKVLRKLGMVIPDSVKHNSNGETV